MYLVLNETNSSFTAQKGSLVVKWEQSKYRSVKAENALGLFYYFRSSLC